MISEQQLQRWIFPSLCAFFALLVMGSRGYEFKYGLEINAPLITPTNPELR